MKLNKFKTRSEVVEFLKGYDFKYYIPEIKENEYYEISITENNKVDSCCIVKLSNDLIYKIDPFYTYSKAYNYDVAEIGEKKARLSELFFKLDSVGLTEEERIELDKLDEELEEF